MGDNQRDILKAHAIMYPNAQPMLRILHSSPAAPQEPWQHPFATEETLPYFRQLSGPTTVFASLFTVALEMEVTVTMITVT
jgi:hypothetical protein